MIVICILQMENSGVIHMLKNNKTTGKENNLSLGVKFLSCTMTIKMAINPCPAEDLDIF